MMRRAIVLVIIYVLAACPAFGDDFEVVRLSERVIVIRNGDPPATMQMTVIRSEKGLVVVDTLSSHVRAERAREIIRREFGSDDVAYVINTHHHFDHTFGNQVFSDAVIIGYEFCAADMLAEYSSPEEYFAAGIETVTPLFERRFEEIGRDSAEGERLLTWFHLFTNAAEELREGFILTPPAITFSDRMTLDCGDLTLRLIYHGRGHSRNDILVFVPEEGIVANGDIFDSLDLPLIYTPDSDIPAWMQAWNAILGSGAEIRYVIGGHAVIFDRETLELFLDYIRELWDEVAAARAEGLSLEEAKESIALGERFEHLAHIHPLTGQDYHLTNIENIWRSQEARSQ